MRCKQAMLRALTAIWLLGLSTAGLPVTALAQAADAPSLVISQLKITSHNGQFVTLYNPAATAVDMSRYQLAYFNSYDPAKATSSRSIELSGTVPPHGYFMVNDSQLLLCYRLTVDSQSLGFASTAGYLEVVAPDQAVQDYVSWSKTAVAGAQTLPADTAAWLQRQPVDEQNNPDIDAPGTGWWQAVRPSADEPCGLVAVGDGTAVPSGPSQLLPAGEPPATIVDLPADDSPAALPAADIGLMAPVVNELLPNPDGTGNDTSAEYVELYNPNPVGFDLGGFKLQTGTTSLHTYTFPGGTGLPAGGFTAFYAAATGLSLSNSGGQAKLLDPADNSISASMAYGSAKDGQAWALAKGKWYWTTRPTPNAANIVKQPAAAKKSAAAVSKAGKSATAKAKTAKKAKAAKATGQSYPADSPSGTPIHARTLALVAGLALLYGAYEYRTDLANTVHKFRRNFAAGRGHRPRIARWRADRTDG